MPEPTSEFIFRFELDLAPNIDIGDVPVGHRIIGPIAGGSFEGPGLSDGTALKGEVVPGGGDWLFIRADGAADLDVRVTLRTADGALIYMPYQGLLVIDPAKMEETMAGKAEPDYMTVALRFETAAEEYAALNKIVAVGKGSLGPANVYYDVFAIR